MGAKKKNTPAASKRPTNETGGAHF